MFKSIVSGLVTGTFKSLKALPSLPTLKPLSILNQTFTRQLSITTTLKALTISPVYTPVGAKKSPGTLEQWKDEDFLRRIHIAGPKKPRSKKHPLDHKPQMKGIVLKTLIRKPKKPNSANRKCVLIRLTNGKDATAFVPGMGHNLQEHSVVLVHKKRVRDVPGLKLRVIRGALDCGQVTKQTK